ncbi:cytochrome P450 [Pseudaestuariivita rosea]|uniref:cytochrome P450 n=1 Tax=Pseudaestuariivita rosea TaxID=2763263 RepID=UPI001ABA90D0|nr:cytochrome P450 [Pseudaestuariivita rosea]
MRYASLFRRDILSAQPERLYRAWMAEFRTPFFRSYLINQPDLVKQVLQDAPQDFPKSDRVGAGLRPLLGESVFVTNGEVWEKQRRIIDPAFEGGRLRDTYPAMYAAGESAVERIGQLADGQRVDIEPETSHAAADVIFRTLFSIPIDHHIAQRVFQEFRDYQRTQPILNLAAFLPRLKWMPRLFRPSTLRAARSIRLLIKELTAERMKAIKDGSAPDDLATKIMTTRDPVTGDLFSTDEMVDQVAIFFLAGHETSASALAWALYLVALYPEWQDRIAAEAAHLNPDDFASLSKLVTTRDVFRETLRLYPPVPMMVRENTVAQTFRGRKIAAGSQIVLSPWHLHRHSRLWHAPDDFDPTRWKSENGKTCQRTAFIPFSAGRRVCIGAGFAMAEGVLLLAILVRHFRFEVNHATPPIPVAHLTVRSKEGIQLKISPRSPKI